MRWRSTAVGTPWHVACCVTSWPPTTATWPAGALGTKGSSAEAKVAAWMGRDDNSLRFTLAMLAELAEQKTLDYPTVSVAVQRLGQLAAHGA
jgi:hypothetical protein